MAPTTVESGKPANYFVYRRENNIERTLNDGNVLAMQALDFRSLVEYTPTVRPQSQAMACCCVLAQYDKGKEIEKRKKLAGSSNHVAACGASTIDTARQIVGRARGSGRHAASRSLHSSVPFTMQAVLTAPGTC